MEEKEKTLVKNWLSEFKGLPEVAVAAYAERVQEKASVVPALYSAMRDMGTELLEPICHQLFEFIRSGEAALHRFALQFVPELIWRHLSAVARRDKPSQGSVEALLLGIYNLETVDDEGKPKVLSFTVPSLSKSSIYHEPCSIGSLALTEEGLSQRGAGKAVYADSYPQRESITAQNRFEVLTSLLLYYNSNIVFMPLSSYHSLCQLCTRACVSGFPRQKMKRDWKEPHPRVPLLAEFLVQLLEGVYHAIYNGAWDMGKRAVEDALYRSKLELYPEPLLLARAIKSSLLQDAPHAGRGRSRCLQLEVTPTSSRISRSVVTSASIRSHRWKKEGEGSEWDQQLDTEEDSSLLEGMGDVLSNGNSSKSPNWWDSDEALVRRERGDKQAVEVDSLPLGTAARPTNGGIVSAVDTSLPTVIFETEFGAHDYSPGLVVPGESRAHLGATPGSPSHSRSCEVVYRSGGRDAGQDSAIDRHSTLSLQDDARGGAEGKTSRLLPEDALKRLQRTPSFKVQLISAL